MSTKFSEQYQENENPGVVKPEMGFGNVKTSFFAYVTPLMIVIASAVTLILVLSAPKIWVFFNTNIYLNGLIIGLGAIGIAGAFNNNIALYRVAKFLDSMEKARLKAKIPPQQVAEFQKTMVKKAPILDTQNMFKAISNLEAFGHYNFTDTDARLIKSKVGYRISGRKSDVGFLSGILVMLGLLGTFLGLLATIDAVGEAMIGMATLDVNEEGAMGTFIESLSRPLQGMGLAFSSSLFGLSGSLMIGFFNFLCGGAQNNFIENFSRWIDNRIPKNVGADGKGGGKGGGDNVPSALKFDQELKDWLSGYVALTVETNKQLKVLAQTLNETLDGFGRGETLLEQISHKQDTQIKHAVTTNNSLSTQENLIGRGNEVLTTISKQHASHMTEMNTRVYPFITIFQDHLVSLLEMTQAHTNALDSGLASIEQTLQMSHYHNQESLDNLNEKLFNITAINEKANEDIENSIQAITRIIQDIDHKYEEMPTIPGRLDHHLGKIADILKDAEKQQKQFFDIFREINGSSGPMAKMLFKMEKSMLEMNKKVFDMEVASKKFVKNLMNNKGKIDPKLGNDNPFDNNEN